MPGGERLSADKGIFNARADAKIGGLDRHAHMQISLRQIAHDLSNLGKQLEKALGNTKKWL